jgi:hypothetical protein
MKNLLAVRVAAVVLTLAILGVAVADAQPQGAVEPPLSVRYAKKAKQADDEMVVGQWYNALALRIAGSQAGFRNWQGGGVNSLSMSGGVDGSAAMKSTKVKQTYEAKLGIGGVSQDNNQLRKSEDVILVSTVYQYLAPQGFFKLWQPTIAASILTQFIAGYDYKTEGEPKVSDFFSPAYVTQSIGLTREIRPWLSQRFGVAGKETIVNIADLRTLYGNTADQTVRAEGGLESWTDFEKAVVENVFIKSSLGIFGAFSDIGSPDINWSNLVTMKVNNWLNVNFELVTVYDRDVTSDLQVREVLSVGVLLVII